MSIDERLRKGMTMIEQQLPNVDTLGAYETVSDELKRRDRRRRTWIAAAAALVLATAGAIALAQRDNETIQPAPPLPKHPHVALLDADNAISYVAEDGSRHALPVKNVDRFALSQDGTKIAYLADNSADPGGWLWIANLDGTARQRIPAPCQGCQPGQGVAWSHDDTRIAYTVFTPGKRPMQLRVRTLATGDEQTFVIRGGFPRGPAFSPDDTKLAMVFADDAGEYVATVDIAAGLPSLHMVSVSHLFVQMPSWSEDGQTIYFTASDVEPDETGATTMERQSVNDLFAVGADGTGDRQITHSADGVRYFFAKPYGDHFLISRIVGDGPLTVGWLSRDGKKFTAIKDADGEPVTGSGAFLQP